MKNIPWTRDELIAYILLFAAHSDFKESKKERDFIISKVNLDTFADIHLEFDNDNDYQSIKKITSSLKQQQFQKEDVDLLLEDIKTLFFRDGKLETTEQIMYQSLKRLFKNL